MMTNRLQIFTGHVSVPVKSFCQLKSYLHLLVQPCTLLEYNTKIISAWLCMMTDHPETFSAILSVLFKRVCHFRYCLHLLVLPCAHHWPTYKDHQRKASHDDQSTWNFLRPCVGTCQILLPIKILSTLAHSTLHSSCLEYNDLRCKALYVNQSSWKFLTPCVCIFQILLPIQILSPLACSTLRSSWPKYKDHERKAFHDDQLTSNCIRLCIGTC
jgi:hypothetical protein